MDRMDRENLFRGKREDNGEWVKGYLWVGNNSSYIIPDNLGVYYDEKEQRIKSFAYKVYPETVCQYTGLTDRNGRRYESDIFQADNGNCIQIYFIVWDEYLLQWSAECIGDPDGTMPLCEFRTDEIEVIGNIFDNPELLEEGSE